MYAMKKIFWFCLLMSALIASYILYIGLNHNAMGEFCTDPNADICSIDYVYAFGIWASWFIVFALPSCGIAQLVKYILSRRDPDQS
jgi:hypothetical protein